MGLGRTHKREFKMRSICTTKKIGRLVQIEWKWCNKVNKDNLKHKLYTTCNHWEEAPLPSIDILCLSTGNTSKCHFSPRLPKLGLLLSQNFGCSNLSQIKSILRMQGNYFIALKNIFSTMYNTLQLDLIWPLILRDLWLEV
jgi:hypothetical protein